MKIVVAVRCMDDERHIERFLHGYDFADAIVVSDGGSQDKSVELLKQNKKVILHYFDDMHEINGIRFNYDAPHMNFVLNKAKELEPDWIIFDDIDDFPTYLLRENARYLFDSVITQPQVNAFRLYMWGENEYFPKMNRNFDPRYTSLWAWQPSKVNIYADENIKHGTLKGLSDKIYHIQPPMALMHYSWHPDTIDAKLARYKAMGLTVNHPFDMPNAKTPAPLPEWAHL